nr:AlpA family transcriptional regulator [Klebsiella michiganensis]
MCCRVISRLKLYLEKENTVTSHQLLRLKQVEEKTGLKRSQIYLYMKEGAFPRSIKIGPASVAWLESEIDDWINLKLANRLTR